MTEVAIVHNIPIHYQQLLFNELAGRGLNFEVLYTAASRGTAVTDVSLEPRLYRSQIGFAGKYEEAKSLPAALWTWKALSRIDPAVTIISGWSDAAAWAAWLWSRSRRRPAILWSESNEWDHPRLLWKESLKSWFLSHCEAAHAYGASSRQYLLSLGMPPERVFTRRALVDTDLYLTGCSDLVHSGPVHLVYVGRFSPEKNLELLLRAIAQVIHRPEDPNLLLTLIGTGPAEERLNALARQLNLLGVVSFLNAAKQSDLPSLYRRADVAVLPSLSETWGLVGLEAMCCGLPVLMSDRCGSASDIITPQTGWLFSPYDEAGLASLLQRISETPRDRLQAMGAAARAIASSYGPQQSAESVLATIRYVSTNVRAFHATP